MLKATPALGRFFESNDGTPGADRTVILSDRLWRQRFRSDPDVMGQRMPIDGRPHTIVGVTRPGFYFPDRRTWLWTPERVPLPSGEGYGRKVSTLFAIGRLQPGVTRDQASAEGTAAARSFGDSLSADLLFGKGGPPTVHARGILEEMTASVRPALLVVTTGVLLVLIIACANIANLLLSRGIVRRRELAIRAAVGASRARLIRQLLTESLALSLAGGGLGLLLGWAVIAVAPALAPSDLPRLDDIQVDWRVMAFAVIVSLVAALLSGLAAAIRGGGFDLSILARGAGSIDASGPGAQRLRDGLLVAEAAVAVVLLVGATLLARSFVYLTHVDAGYTATNVLTARIYLPASSQSPDRAQQLLEGLRARLQHVPAVVAVGGGNMMPFGDSTYLSGFTVPARERGGVPVEARALEYAVTPGYAEALGLRLREGRFFTGQDTGSETSPVLVNEEFGRLYLAGSAMAGRVFPTGIGSSDKTAVIVGVVANVLKDGLDQAPQPEIYLSLQHGMRMREINVVVRTAGNPATIAPQFRDLVRELDPGAPIASIAPLTQLRSASVEQPRFGAIVVGTFAIVALTLAAVGLYGVLSYAVSQRRHEFGVRTALGADRSAVITLVMRYGMSVTVKGIAVGLVAAVVLATLMKGMLFGVSPLDRFSFVAAPSFLALIAALACLWPALRAASADPAEILRSE